MFFIIGMDQGRKEIGNQGPYTCGSCGCVGRYQIYMTFMCLSLFFIPILKWGRRYYVEMSCCHSVYELNPEVGNRLRRGGQAEIQAADLTLVHQGHSYGTYFRGTSAEENSDSGSDTDLGRKCLVCGYETMEDFDFCPKCGEKLRYKVK